jgi:hypothetical protein
MQNSKLVYFKKNLLVFFTPMRNKSKYYVYLGEPLRGLCPLASGYPLHHLRASLRLPFGGSATIPLASRPSVAQ